MITEKEKEENLHPRRRKTTEKEKEEIIWRRKNRLTDWVNIEQSAFYNVRQ